jgi:hypothetical protein
MSAIARSTESNLVIAATSSQDPPEALRCCIQYEPPRRRRYCHGSLTGNVQQSLA